MDRYCISYKLRNGKWEEVTAKTIKEARTLYDIVGDEAEFKVLYDQVNGDQIEQT